MASLIEELIHTLEEEYEIYKQLIPIAENKTQVIISNDLDNLRDITDREQVMVDKVTALERKRENIIGNIGTVISRDPKTIHIKTIIQILDKQPKEQRQLSEIHDNLKKQFKDLLISTIITNR